MVIKKKGPLNLKCNDSKRAEASKGRNLPLWQGPLGSSCWGFGSVDRSCGSGTGLGEPTPGNPGEAGSGGRRARDLRAPPRCRQLAWGWGVTASSSCHCRHVAAAAIRDVRDGFLLPAQSGRRSEAGSTPVFFIHTSVLVASVSPAGSPWGLLEAASAGTR